MTSQDHHYEGFVKCRLGHSDCHSLIIIESFFIEFDEQVFWYQPLFYTSSMVLECDDGIDCRVHCDIEGADSIQFSWSEKDVESTLPDRSVLYRCRILSKTGLEPLATGKARITNGTPFLLLHHHTNGEAKASILDGASFRTSSWNIQGNKKFSNFSFLYMTSLERIGSEEDLRKIAMASDGKLGFRLDDNHTSNPDLVLDVYRESTLNRTDTITVWVNSCDLAPQPSYWHKPTGQAWYHEVVGPLIYRISTEPSGTVEILDTELVPKHRKPMAYAVIGDANTIEGLKAPYDEEETHQIYKFQPFSEDEEILRFWVDNANSDQYSGQDVEALEVGG